MSDCINIAFLLYSCFRRLRKLQQYSKQVVGSGLSREEARKTFQMMCLYVYGCLCGNLRLRQSLNVHLQPHPSAKERDSCIASCFLSPPFCPFLLTHHIDSRPSPLLASTLTFRFFFFILKWKGCGTSGSPSKEGRIWQLLVWNRREENYKNELQGSPGHAHPLPWDMPMLRSPMPEVLKLGCESQSPEEFLNSKAPIPD